jgi:hypothetical protein
MPLAEPFRRVCHDLQELVALHVSPAVSRRVTTAMLFSRHWAPCRTFPVAPLSNQENSGLGPRLLRADSMTA